jgi:hypothetical protein
MPFTYITPAGRTYYLHGKIVTLANGRVQTVYYFAPQPKPDEVLDGVPAGYRVTVSARPPRPFLRKHGPA